MVRKITPGGIVTIREYFNRMADSWDEAVAEKDTLKLKQMVGRLNIRPGSTVLDVGTGTGVFLPYLLDELGKDGRIIALDFAGKMLERAQAKNFDGNVDFLCTDVVDIPLDDERFDIVVCYSSFPHFQDKPRALAEMGRVIKGGGRLLICHTSSRARINQIHRPVPLFKNDTLPDRDEMQLMLSAAGFTGIRIDDSRDSYLASAEKPEHKIQ